MKLANKTGLGVTGGLAATPALALEAPYQVVPPAERLTVGGVWADASLEVQLMMAVMALGVLASLAVWALSLRKVGGGDAKGLASALGRLRIVRSGAMPFGVFTAFYVLFAMFIGIANVRPVPTLSILAPGFAEATLAMMLGLLATAVAVICERHLEGRIRRAAA